jgi:hypothetical protein
MDMASYSFYYGDDGVKPAAPEPEPDPGLLIIHDEFDGALGTEVNGREPDTVNTPGNLWIVEALGQIELDGAGAARSATTSTPRAAQIDSEVVNNLQRSEVSWLSAGGGNNLRGGVFILANGAWGGGDPNDMLEFRFNNFTNQDVDLAQTINNTTTVLASHQTLSAVYDYPDLVRIENDNGTIRCYYRGVEIAALTTVYSIPAGLDGNPFVGFNHRGNFQPTPLYHYFKAWDLT